MEKQNSIEFDEEEKEEDNKHFEQIIHALGYYRTYADFLINRIERQFLQIPKKHQLLVPTMAPKIQSLREAANKNAIFIDMMLEFEQIFENSEGHNSQTKDKEKPSGWNMDKVKTTLKQFVRDWSVEGENERNMCYKPMLEELDDYFQNVQQKNQLNILIPGAGLGRLTYEVAKRGYNSQGNEFSYFMLVASNFVLNRLHKSIEIHPWIHSTSNVLNSAEQLRAVAIPDEVAGQHIPKNVEFSMTAGDFLTAYQDSNEKFDGILTCFFIDTANNVIQYIETIRKILKPGGVWINLGPLLYHYAEMDNEISIELSYDQIKQVILGYGFEFKYETSNKFFLQHFKKKETMVPSTYTNNQASMLQVQYNCSFFTCTKK